MKYLLFTLLALFLVSFSAKNKSGNNPSKYSTDGKTITVYTTADKTDLRITSTGTLKFTDFGQPLETQEVCIC